MTHLDYKSLDSLREIGIEQLKKVFVEAGFTVTEIAETEAKELD